MEKVMEKNLVFGRALITGDAKVSGDNETTE